jgi:hypothetical protein
MRELDPRIDLFCALTRVFDALCPAMNDAIVWRGHTN